MAVTVVFAWSIRPEDRTAVEAQLAVIAEHVRTEHPDILSTRLYRQWAGPLPRVAYIWLERYDSLTAIDEAVGTPACLDVWRPVEAAAQPGTWTTSTWMDGPGDTRVELYGGAFGVSGLDADCVGELSLYSGVEKREAQEAREDAAVLPTEIVEIIDACRLLQDRERARFTIWVSPAR